MTLVVNGATESSSVNVPFSRRPIIILGAGIIGCAAAHQLLQRGFEVILVAEYLPGDKSIFYASAWAGAAWHSAGGLTNDYKYLQVASYRHLLKFALEEPEAGVCMINSREYLEELPGENSAIWGRTVVSNVSFALSFHLLLLNDIHSFGSSRLMNIHQILHVAGRMTVW